MRRDQLFQLSNLGALKNLTFDNFKPRGRIGLGALQADSLEQAYNSAMNFAGTLRGWLLLLGKYGCGKTHLAAAIANQAVSMGVSTLFLTVPDLLDWLRFSYSEGSEDSFEQRFEEIRNIPLLIMDDFGTQNATSWAQEKLFQILNYRYSARMPTVITSNRELETIDGRLRSRMVDPDLAVIVTILAPDFRGSGVSLSPAASLSSLNHHEDQTFETFNVNRKDISVEDRENLKRAFKTAKDFAENPRLWLVFSGPYGCGKTHLAAAIANYQIEMGNPPPLFVVVPDLLDHLRATFNPNHPINYDRRFEDIRQTSLLILDDLGTESATPWAKEKLFQIFNYRYNARLPTVITTLDRVDDIEPRLLTRMLDEMRCTIFAIAAPSYRGPRQPDGGKVQRASRNRRATS